ncbi:hypothetical protein LSAT2_021651 [Lamellibrachia satsuma]|nr:hypothetical protein LSAT2_021651 [Lamellibrachia satsuma]
MYALVAVKFRNPTLRKRLLATGKAELKEWVKSREGYWGALTYSGQAGQNMLGQILMKVREFIRRHENPPTVKLTPDLTRLTLAFRSPSTSTSTSTSINERTMAAAQQYNADEMTITRLETQDDDADVAAASATSSDVVSVRNGREKNGLTQLQRAYKRQVSAMYEAEEEKEAEEKEVKRQRGEAPTTSTQTHDSYPETQEMPWGPLYVSDDDDDDEKMTMKTVRKKPRLKTPASKATVVLKPDGGVVNIPDQCIKESEPSTSTQEEDAFPASQTHTNTTTTNNNNNNNNNNEEEEEEESSANLGHLQVCYIMLEEAMSHIVANEWRQSSQSLQDITQHVCETTAASILSTQYQERLLSQARLVIRR